MDSVCQGLTLSLASEFGDDLRINYDASNVEALWPLFQKRLDAAKTLIELGYPMNAINERLNLGMADITSGHIEWAPSSRVPAAVFSEDSMTDGGVSG